MKQIKTLLSLVILTLANFVSAQSPSYYDITFEVDSLVSPFKSNGSNYVFVRSKRGVDGLNPTTSADSIKTFTISKIVLVFSEESSDALETREEYNQERWENLMLTYPEFFQEKTTYKNICQCSPNAGGSEFKQVQGFYVYYKSAKIAAPVKKAEEPTVRTEAPAKEAANKEEPAKKGAAVEVAIAAAIPVVAATKPETKAAEPIAKKESERKKGEVELIEEKEEVVAAAPKKKTVSSKPRKAKDPKACRPTCYGFGDDDLNAFFKDNMTLSKKERRKAKGWVANVRLQINFDGSIKKAIVTGADTEFNQRVELVVKNMNNWNAAVKNGLTVKSEVRFVLKYDKETKALKPFDMLINPRLAPKCKCTSDEELFGS